MRKPILFLALTGLSFGMVSCAPRYVTGVTGNMEQIKFVYEQPKLLGGSTTGLVKCKLDVGGALKECRNMAVVFKSK